ncbi:MAG: VOC family protein [Chloroflexi bacterium]|nr:VOC family protein [Chloroflexota bacterium]
MANPIVHWEIVGGDVKKLSAFYKNIFGWKIENTPMNYSIVDTGDPGVGINGGIGAGEGGAKHVTFYASVDDLGATLKKIEKAGGKTVVPPTVIPNMVTFALFTDPEGHMVGLVKDDGQH